MLRQDDKWPKVKSCNIDWCRGEIMATKYRVVQVKGAKPETFIVVGIDFNQGTITSTSASMHEKEMRSHLEKAGASKNDIEMWIEQARKYPG